MAASKQNIDKNIDLNNKDRGIWLVKIPKYIANRWEKAPGHMEVGKVKITRSAGQVPAVSLALSEGILAMDEGETDIPKHYRLDVSNVSQQTLGVFSVTEPETDKEATKLLMEGKIVQKLECRPYADNCYMKLKKDAIRKAAMPNRKLKQLDKIVQCYKPVSNHKVNKDYNDKMKVEGKRIRNEKNTVAEMLFNAFEKHQYYNIKDLVKITKQPIVYLKTILNEYCVYNFKHPHRNMWQLKPEYSSYEKKVQSESANE